MTLTITLAAEGLLVQSSDHRLTVQPGVRLVTDAEPKQMYATANDWAAVIGFAGIGQVRTRHATLRASDVVSAAISSTPRAASFDEVANAIALRATRWLSGLSGDRRHTFVMAGMLIEPTEIVTRVAIISNWQRPLLAGDSLLRTEDEIEAAGEFSVNAFDAENPVIFVAGCHGAVTRDELLRLTRMVNHKRTTAQIARAMAYINRAASVRPAARDAVSPHCTSVAVLLSHTQINGSAMAHAEHEQPVEVLQASALFRDLIDKAARQLQRDGVLPPGPLQPPRASTFAKGIPRRCGGTPYARPDDRLWVDGAQT